jgi:hypothetical protein
MCSLKDEEPLTDRNTVAFTRRPFAVPGRRGCLVGCTQHPKVFIEKAFSLSKENNGKISNAAQIRKRKKVKLAEGTGRSCVYICININTISFLVNFFLLLNYFFVMSEEIKTAFDTFLTVCFLCS